MPAYRLINRLISLVGKMPAYRLISLVGKMSAYRLINLVGKMPAYHGGRLLCKNLPKARAQKKSAVTPRSASK